MPTTAQILAQDATHVAHVMFVDGWPHAFTDHPALAGSGAGSWIGSSETELASETLGQRTVMHNLDLPSLTRETSKVEGLIVPKDANIGLYDDERGTIARLLAPEGKEGDRLGQLVAAGVEPLPDTLIVVAGVPTVTNPHGRYIGLERIGPAGERRRFPFIPFALVGFDHSVHSEIPENTPWTPISDEPIVNEGRLISVYRLVHDPTRGDPMSAASWPTWLEALDAGGRIWSGKLTNRVSYDGARKLKLRCTGEESLFRRTFGYATHKDWIKITAEFTAYPEERGICVVFAGARPIGGLPDLASFQASVFANSLLATTKSELRSEIDSLIQNTINGTTANANLADIPATDWEVVGENQQVAAGLTAGSNAFFVRKRDQVSNQRSFRMYIVAHSIVWRTLGYEPETQHSQFPMEDKYRARFGLVGGTRLTIRLLLDLDLVPPSSGYWIGEFTTIAIGADPADGESYNRLDNDGSPRYHYPAHVGAYVVRSNGNQVIRLLSEFPYVPGSKCLPVLGGAEIGGQQTTDARLWAMRGQIARSVGVVDGEVEIETEDRYGVFVGSYRTSGNGSILDGGAANPGIHIDKWLDPRRFGFDDRVLDRDWVGKSEGDNDLEIVPLTAWPLSYEDNEEFAHTLFYSWLVSTGSAGGYDGPYNGGMPVFHFGDNHRPDAGETTGADIFLGEYGLGIPHQLLAPPPAFRVAFGSNPGGVLGDLNKLRPCVVGSIPSGRLLSEVMLPRRLAWSMDGGVYSLYRIGPVSPGDIQIVITDADLHTTSRDKRNAHPTATPGANLPFDRVEFEYHIHPDTRDSRTIEIEALDEGAPLRQGANTRDLIGLGMSRMVGWGSELRQLWGRDAATFDARPHIEVQFTVGPHLAQRVAPGTAFVMRSSWILETTGVYGTTNAFARMRSTTYNPRTGATRCIATIYVGSGSGTPITGGAARVASYNGAELTCHPDAFGRGDDTRDVGAFGEPWWSDTGGQCAVRLWQRQGSSWSFAVHMVASVNTALNRVTVTAPPTEILRDTDKVLTIANYDEQPEGNWVRAHLGFVTRTDLTHSAGNVVGRRFV